MAQELHDGEHVPATVATLLAAALYLGSSCRAPNDAYMRCRRRHTRPGDPDGTTYDAAACAAEAAAVLACTRAFFRAVAGTPCVGAWRGVLRCLDANNLNAIYCRAEQRALDACMAGVAEFGVSKSGSDSHSGDDGGAANGSGAHAGLAPPGEERLWRGTGADGEGTHPPRTYPEDGSVMYAWHVLRHKRAPVSPRVSGRSGE